MSPEEKNQVHLSLTQLTISGLLCAAVGFVMLLLVFLLSCSVEYHQFHATLLGTSDWSTEGGVFILCYQTPTIFQKL